MKSRGYALIKLIRAIGDSTDIKTHSTYEVEITNQFNMTRICEMKSREIDREWCRLRMNEDRFAKLSSGLVNPISEEEYLKLK